MVSCHVLPSYSSHGYRQVVKPPSSRRDAPPCLPTASAKTRCEPLMQNALSFDPRLFGQLAFPTAKSLRLKIPFGALVGGKPKSNSMAGNLSPAAAKPRTPGSKGAKCGNYASILIKTCTLALALLHPYLVELQDRGCDHPHDHGRPCFDFLLQVTLQQCQNRNCSCCCTHAIASAGTAACVLLSLVLLLPPHLDEALLPLSSIASNQHGHDRR